MNFALYNIDFAHSSHNSFFINCIHFAFFLVLFSMLVVFCKMFEFSTYETITFGLLLELLFSLLEGFLLFDLLDDSIFSTALTFEMPSKVFSFLSILPQFEDIFEFILDNNLWNYEESFFRYPFQAIKNFAMITST